MDRNIFALREKYQKSKDARFTGYKWVTPIIEDDGKTGALLVYVEPGTDLSKRPPLLKGSRLITKNENKPLPELKADVPSSKGRVPRAYPLLPLLTQHWIANNVEALLTERKVPFSHLELRPGNGGIVALLIHFDSVETFMSEGAAVAAKVLVPFTHVLPVVLLAEENHLYTEL